MRLSSNFEELNYRLAGQRFHLQRFCSQPILPGAWKWLFQQFQFFPSPWRGLFPLPLAKEVLAIVDTASHCHPCVLLFACRTNTAKCVNALKNSASSGAHEKREKRRETLARSLRFPSLGRSSSLVFRPALYCAFPGVELYLPRSGVRLSPLVQWGN